MIISDEKSLELGQTIMREIGVMLLNPDYHPVCKLPVHIPGYDFGDGRVDGATGTFTIRIERPHPDTVQRD